MSTVFDFPRAAEALTAYAVERQAGFAQHQGRQFRQPEERNRWIRGILRGMADVCGADQDAPIRQFDQRLEEAHGCFAVETLGLPEQRHTIQSLRRYADQLDLKLDAYEPQEVYSTEETRIGTWIDGKPLYRKAYTFNLPSAISENGYNILQYPDTFEVKKYSGFFVGMWNEINILPHMWGKYYVTCCFMSHWIRIAFNTNEYADKLVTLCLEYTKTTDQAQITAANTVLKAPALNAIQSAAVTASGAAEIEI